MTSKEALKELILKYNIPHHILEPLRLLDKRDTPKRPIKITIDVIAQHNCSACKRRLDMAQLREVNFCPKCGQRLDWSNE